VIKDNYLEDHFDVSSSISNKARLLASPESLREIYPAMQLQIIITKGKSLATRKYINILEKTV